MAIHQLLSPTYFSTLLPGFFPGLFLGRLPAQRSHRYDRCADGGFSRANLRCARGARVVLASLFGLLAACAPPELTAPPPDESLLLDPAQYRSAQEQARAQLQQVYGAQLRLRTDAQRGTVAFLEAAAIPLPDAASPSTALTSFVTAYRSLFGILTEDDLKSVSTTTDLQGLTHVRIVQLQDGVPIWGSLLVGHLDARGLLLRIHARLFGLHLWPSAPSAPMLKSEDARQQALSILRGEIPTLSAAASPPSLYFLPGEQRLVLVYRVEVYGQVGDDPLRLALFINAHTGEVVRREDRVARIPDVPPVTRALRFAIPSVFIDRRRRSKTM